MGLDVVDFDGGDAEREHDFLFGFDALVLAISGGASHDDDDRSGSGQPAAVAPDWGRSAAANATQDAAGEIGRRILTSERVLEFLF